MSHIEMRCRLLLAEMHAVRGLAEVCAELLEMTYNQVFESFSHELVRLEAELTTLIVQVRRQ